MQNQMVQGDALDFNANMYDPTQGAGSLPLGTHKVVIERSEKKETSAGGSGMLILHLKIIEGQNAGMTGGMNFNLWNANPKACEIAHKDLSAVCHVCGVFEVKNTSQLFGIPFVVEVVQQKNNPEYNEVKKVFDVNGQPPRRGQLPSAPPAQAQQPQAQNQAPPQQQAPAPNGATPPWGGQPAAQTAPAAPPAAPQQQQAAATPPWGGQQAAAPAQQAPPQVAQQQAPWAGQQQQAPAATPPWA